MAKTIIKIFIAVTVVTTAVPAIASDSKPEWATRKPTDDDRYRYYVGRSSRSASESSAFNEATMDAIYQAIRDNYGFNSQINIESYETGDRANLVQRVKEASKNIKFQDFEQVDSYTEAGGDGRFDAWVLFRYGKSAIAKEKTRLKSAKVADENTRVEFSTVGAISDANKGTLEVISDPPDATVVVDGNRWGQTPLRIIGKLSPGKHTVRLDHPEFETVQDDIILSLGGNHSFKRTLVKSGGAVKVVTNPPNASVFIDGEYIGSSPTNFFTVSAGATHTLKATHEEADTYSQEFQVQRDDQRILKIGLPRKQSTVAISVEPKDAKIFINDKLVEIGKNPIALNAGTYKLTVKKDLFIPYKETFELRGGQRLVLKPIKLVSYSFALRFAKYSIDNPLNLSFGYGIFAMKVKGGDVGVGSPFGANVSIEKQFFATVGLKATYRLIGHPLTKKVRKYSEQDRLEDNSTDDKNVGSISGSIVDFGLPIYLGSGGVKTKTTGEVIANTRGNFYLMPIYSMASGRYTITKTDLVPDVESSGSFSTKGYGGEVGMYWQSGAFNWRILAGLTQYSNSGYVNKLSPSQVFNLGLELGWTVGGISVDGINRMEKELREASK